MNKVTPFTKPARKIGLKSGSITGKHPSRKTGISHPFESSLERDYLVLLEFDQTVDSYCVQPVTIRYDNGGRVRKYTPDMAVYFKAQAERLPLLVEIKYESELKAKKDLLQPKFDAAISYGLESGFEFCVKTEKHIRTDYLYNAKFLSQYSRTPANTELLPSITSMLNSKEKMIVAELLERLSVKIGDGLYAVWHLLYLQILKCNLEKKITMQTQVWLNN